MVLLCREKKRQQSCWPLSSADSFKQISKQDDALYFYAVIVTSYEKKTNILNNSRVCVLPQSRAVPNTSAFDYRYCTQSIPVFILSTLIMVCFNRAKIDWSENSRHK